MKLSQTENEVKFHWLIITENLKKFVSTMDHDSDVTVEDSDVTVEDSDVTVEDSNVCPL